MMIRFLPVFLISALLSLAQTASDVQIVTGLPGVAIESGNVLSVALPLINISEDTGATNLTVTNVTLTSGVRIAPASFPVALGSFSSGQRAVINTRFTLTTNSAARYLMTVTGTYTIARQVFGYQVNRLLVLPTSGPGFATLRTSFVTPRRITGGPFPAKPIAADNEINPQGRPVPLGPSRVVFGPTTTGSLVKDFSHLPVLPGPQGDNSVAFVKNTILTGAGFPPDPSVASSGNVVVASANTLLQISTDGGKTFTQYNPGTIFPDNPDGGLCCDQVLQYAPSIDRFIWVIQTWRATLSTDTPETGATGPNRERIAIASPANLINNVYSAWSTFDITPDLLSLPANAFLDYPDLAIGDNYLYLSEDEVGVGLEVARIPLADLVSGGIMQIQYTDPSLSSVAYGSHVSQNAGDAVYWAGHNSTSSMRIFHCAENSNSYNWNDIDVDSWANSDYTSQAADGQYWLPGPLGSSVTGATRKPSEVWFAWPAGRDTTAGRAQPYIEMVSVDDQTLKQVGHMQVWNNDYAFAYPSLTTDTSNGDIVMSISSGGNGAYYGNNFAGFWGDFVVYGTGDSDVTLTGTPPSPGCPDVSGGVTPTRCTRFGDYYSVRPIPQQPGLFGTLGYAVKAVDPTKSKDCTIAPGCKIDLHYVEFGRYSTVFPTPPPIH